MGQILQKKIGGQGEFTFWPPSLRTGHPSCEIPNDAPEDCQKSIQIKIVKKSYKIRIVRKYIKLELDSILHRYKFNLKLTAHKFRLKSDSIIHKYIKVKLR